MNKDTRRYVIEGISAAAIAVGSFILGKKSANKSTNEEYYLEDDEVEAVEEAPAEAPVNDAE